jgi:hypothetical protein
VTGKPGLEIMKLFGFRSKPTGIEKVMGKTIIPGSADWNDLTQMLEIYKPSQSNTISQHTISITSYSKDDIEKR